MKKHIIAAVLLSAVLAFSGCGQPVPTPISKRDSIPFEERQLYAAAYLGYQTIGKRGLDLTKPSTNAENEVDWG